MRLLGCQAGTVLANAPGGLHLPTARAAKFCCRLQVGTACLRCGKAGMAWTGVFSVCVVDGWLVGGGHARAWRAAAMRGEVSGRTLPVPVAQQPSRKWQLPATGNNRGSAACACLPSPAVGPAAVPKAVALAPAPACLPGQRFRALWRSRRGTLILQNCQCYGITSAQNSVKE